MDIIPSRYPMRTKEQSRSDGQFNLGRQIKGLYGPATVLEEFPIPETRLSLDFYMPQHNLAFEFQGIQHDGFVQYFHGDKDGFDRQVARDATKREWCMLNNITLIEVRNASISSDELRALIQEIRNNEG